MFFADAASSARKRSGSTTLESERPAKALDTSAYDPTFASSSKFTDTERHASSTNRGRTTAPSQSIIKDEKPWTTISAPAAQSTLGAHMVKKLAAETITSCVDEVEDEENTAKMAADKDEGKLDKAREEKALLELLPVFYDGTPRGCDHSPGKAMLQLNSIRLIKIIVSLTTGGNTRSGCPTLLTRPNMIYSVKIPSLRSHSVVMPRSLGRRSVPNISHQLLTRMDLVALFS